MSSLIHMEVERVEATIATLETTIRQWQSASQSLRQAGYRLHGAWQGGPASETFIQELLQLIQRCEAAGQELERLVRLLQREKEEWLAAAASFGVGVATGAGIVAGAGGAGTAQAPSLPPWAEHICKGRKDEGRCLAIWAKPPQNAYELAYMIATLPEDQPIGIFPLGNGEVLVLLKGTDPDSPERGNNWGSAVESFFTHNSSYQLSVLAALQASIARGLISPGAKLHIAGHSQGGMVAQNLASDPRVRKMGLNVETVVTFGSPDTFTRANPDVKYFMFEEDSDVVPKIDEYAESYIKRRAAVSKSPHDKVIWTSAKIIAHQRLNDVERLAHRYVIHTPEGNPFKAHDYARLGMKPELTSIKIPLGNQSSEWGKAGFYQSTIRTPLAKMYSELGGLWKRIRYKGGGGGGASGGW